MGERIAQHVTGMPAPPLRALVRRYTGYHYAGFGPGIHVGLPSRHLTFIVSLGPPLELGDLHAPAAPVQRFDALVAGLHTAPVAVHHDGTQHGVQLEVTPRGARALFGLPAAGIAGVSVHMDAVLGRVAAELVDRLRAAGTWADRFAVLDAVLARAAARAGAAPTAGGHALRASTGAAPTVHVGGVAEPAPEVSHAWRRLTATGGALGIGHLATEVGWSRRHLSERFRDEYGLAPKALARVVRFERARRMLAVAAPPALGEVAAAAGYADQAHMNRDWRAFAGASPTRWMADEQLPFVQDQPVGPPQTDGHERTTPPQDHLAVHQLR